MEDKNNSFKALEKEQVQLYGKNIDKVKKSIDGNLSGLSFFTNVIELYFARVVSYMLSMGGGEKDDNNEESD